jgi:hypothetical protein
MNTFVFTDEEVEALESFIKAGLSPLKQKIIDDQCFYKIDPIQQRATEILKKLKKQ